MLNFLKKIFQNGGQEGKKILKIRLHELNEWLNEKSKPVMEEMDGRVKGILMKIDEEAQRTRVNLELLEYAKLQNENIPYRAKQYMDGNRKAYVRAVSSFLGHLEINNRDYFYLVDFCKFFDDIILKLNKGTLRSYTILQEFFANETGKIAQNLKDFDGLFSALKSELNNKDVLAVNKAIEKIKMLDSRSKQKINLSIDVKNMEAELSIANTEKMAVMGGIEEFKSGPGYLDFQKLSEEKKIKTSAFYAGEDQILQSFSVMERALRKYSHVAFEHEEIVLEYLNNPIETLAGDKNLAILDILKNMEKLMNEDKIKIDGRKKEKSIEEIRRLDKDYIGNFLARYNSFKSELEDIENRIIGSNYIERLKKFNKQLEGINLRIERQGREFNLLKTELDKAENSVQTLTSEIEGSISKLFNEAVKIEI